MLVTTPSGSGCGRRASKQLGEVAQALPFGSMRLVAKQRDNAARLHPGTGPPLPEDQRLSFPDYHRQRQSHLVPSGPV
jgi:hypothetical protein